MSDNSESKFMNIFIAVFLVMIGFSFFVGFLAIAMKAILGEEAPEAAIVALADERIKPVGEVYIDGEAVAVAESDEPVQSTITTAAAEAPEGETIYKTACFSCHTTGLAGAPKYGSSDDWAPRLAQGMDLIYEHSLKGFNAMPPKGGFVNYSDDQVKAAVDYMVEAVK